MNYCALTIDTLGARTYQTRKYQFDYMEPVAFEREKARHSLSVIGYMKLSEIAAEDTIDQVIITNGLDDYCFKLRSFKENQKIKKRNLIGYVQVAKYDYVAVYKRNIILPIMLSCILILAAILL